MSNHNASPALIDIARNLADDEDRYEMDSCAESFASCADPACIHVILMNAARKVA